MIHVNEQTMTAEEFRVELADIFNRMRIMPAEAVYIERYGKSIGVLVSHKLWARIVENCPELAGEKGETNG